MVADTTTRRGRCNNVGMCENAVFQRPITVPDGEPFVCPQCLGELTDVRVRETARKPSRVVVPLVALSLSLAVAGYAAWREYGAPHAAPVLAETSMAPAAPVGAGPAPAAPANAGEPMPAGTQGKMMAFAGPAGPPPAPASAAPVSPALDTAAGPALASSAAPPVLPTTGAPPASGHAATGPTSGNAPAAPGPMATQLPPQPPAATAPATVPPSGTATALAAPPIATAPAATPSRPAAEAEAVPSSVGAVQAAPQAVRDFLGGAKPVPVTFHFKPNSALLNSHGDRDVAHLVAYLAAHHASGAQLYLAGFTDNLGSPEGNVEFAKRRVATVVAALSAAGVKPAHVASFGAEMPVADNATPRGREENRRVDVYLGQ